MRRALALAALVAALVGTAAGAWWAVRQGEAALTALLDHIQDYDKNEQR